MRRLILLAAALCLLAACASADTVITMTFAGDCTLGCTDASRRWDTSFDSVADATGLDSFLAPFDDLFSADDLTIVNLEGVLSDSAAGARSNKNFVFRGGTRFTGILTGHSVELASLANNHAEDYGSRGLRSTQEALEAAGIPWIRRTEGYIYARGGVRVAVFALDAAGFRREGARVCAEIARLKEEGLVNAAVAIFHGGKEYVPRHYAVQSNAAQALIDAGADLVIMHHPHVVQGVAWYRDRCVCYSLGNFVFGGNTRIQSRTWYRTHIATSLYGLVAQADLYFSDDGAYLGQEIRLYPVFTSGDRRLNDYHPRPVTGDEAAEVMACVQFDTAFDLPPFDPETGCVTLPLRPAGGE